MWVVKGTLGHCGLFTRENDELAANTMDFIKTHCGKISTSKEKDGDLNSMSARTVAS